jgi:hypothetical protein
VAGQRKRECVWGYAGGDGDLLGIGSGDGVGSAADGVESGRVAILLVDVQFHEYGGDGDL